MIRTSSFVGLTAALAAGCGILPAAAPSARVNAPSAQEIIRRSVENNDRNWKVAPEFAFTEQDVVRNGGKKTDRTYENIMIEGSPYQKLIAIDGEPLSRRKADAEDRKLQQAIQRRSSESEADRRARIEQYERERRQNHELMSQMTKAFDFKLTGEETVNGRGCYVLDGTPRADYTPINRETEVLKGMRGRLWVDKEEFQWVKVHAEVFQPVEYGLFVAKVQPGTEFTLEMGPVGGGIWLPTRFSQDVNADVMFFWQHKTSEHDTYWGYKRTGPENMRAAVE